MAINLSVNLNKVALLRNSRGANNPSPRVAAHACIDAGASGLTLHWRADNRHTREGDVRDLRAIAAERGVEFNLEGDERPELSALAAELRVDQFTLVPVRPGEITSDHGWELPAQTEQIRRVLAPLAERGVRTAIFMDPVPEAMARAAATGAHRVELYTEPYAAAWTTPRRHDELERFKACARALAAAGLGVNQHAHPAVRADAAQRPGAGHRRPVELHRPHLPERAAAGAGAAAGDGVAGGGAGAARGGGPR